MLEMISHRHMAPVAALARSVYSALHGDQSKLKWRSRLTNPSTAVLLRQQNRNVVHLQVILRAFSASGRKTVSSVIIYLVKNMCVNSDDNILSLGSLSTKNCCAVFDQDIKLRLDSR